MKNLLLYACTLSAAFVIATVSIAGDVELKVGDKAPVFQAMDDQGKTWKSTDFVGKKVIVVYFYPADFTGGCTNQACGFRDDFKTLAGKDAMVIGVSGDTAETHALFKKFHKLPFTLLADTKGKISQAFGVPTGKGGSIVRDPFGEKVKLTRGVTIQRWTFVIGKDGKIAKITRNADSSKDSKDILEFLNKKGSGDSSKGNVKSGPQVGQDVPGPFHPLNVTGAQAGEKHSLYCENGVNPVAVVFARKVSKPLVTLIKEIDQATAKNKKAHMGSFVVFLGGDESLAKQLQAIAAKEKIQHTVLSIDNPNGPADYKIAREAEVTVLLYENVTVRANFAFGEGRLDSTAVRQVIANIPKILPK